jgi:fumarate reductase flavoprotein subunit
MKRRDVLKLAAASIAIKPAAALAAAAQDTAADIIVIGSGGAGFAAAITAHDLGAKVIVLEKMPITGGNTQIASGGMNAAGTRYQAEKGIKDDWQLMYDDTLKGGKNRGTPALVEILAKNSAGAADWMVSLGADLSGITRGGGASADRFHAPKDGSPVGPNLMKALRSAADERKIDVRSNSLVLQINTNSSGAVTGVKVRERTDHLYKIDAKVVVLASGGFSANKEMVAKYCPQCVGMATSNQPGATGDGIRLAEALGAELRDMDQVQIHPSLAAGTNILVSEASRGAGAIMVNREGKRFINELTTRDAASAAIMAQTGKAVFLIFDGNVRDRLKSLEGYFHLGMAKEAPTLEALAQILGVDPATFAATIATYNKYQEAKDDPEFKRPNMALPLNRPNYCSIEIQPGVHYTMGGVLINERTQALGRDGKPIPGLYAAGEVTGGVHGANRLGGNSTVETIVFGRIAGREAAQYARSAP